VGAVGDIRIAGADGWIASNCALIPIGIETDPQEARQHFFLKKEAKTLVRWRARWNHGAP